MARWRLNPFKRRNEYVKGRWPNIADFWRSRTFTCQSVRDDPITLIHVDNRSFARSRKRVQTSWDRDRSTNFPPRADTYAPFESAFTVRFKVWKIICKQPKRFPSFVLFYFGSNKNDRHRTRGLPISRPKEICTGIDRPIDWRGTSRVDENPATSAISFARMACGGRRIVRRIVIKIFSLPSRTKIGDKILTRWSCLR